MYAIVKTGGKQYRVEQGQSLLIERLPVSEGDAVSLDPLLYVDDSEVVDADGLSRVSVEARVVAHERGPKLRVVKFKPKRGYKRRTGHRQELTRIEVVGIKLASGRSRRRTAAADDQAEAPEPVAAAPAAEPKPRAPRAAKKPATSAKKPAATSAKKPAATEKTPPSAAEKPTSTADEATTATTKEDNDGA